MDNERESRIFALLAQGIDKYPGVSETLERLAVNIQMCMDMDTSDSFSPKNYAFVDHWLDSLTFEQIKELEKKIDKRKGRFWR